MNVPFFNLINPKMDVPGFNFIKNNNKLCVISKDKYYQCLSDQNVDFEKINKFKCINELYDFETYCEPSKIFNSKLEFLRNNALKDLTKENIDYLNTKAYYFSKIPIEELSYVNSLGDKF